MHANSWAPGLGGGKNEEDGDGKGEDDGGLSITRDKRGGSGLPIRLLVVVVVESKTEAMDRNGE